MATRQSISPADLLSSHLSDSEIMRKSREEGVTERVRKVQITDFLRSLVFSLVRQDGQSIMGARRHFILSTGVSLARSSFWGRFTEAFERLVAWVLGQLVKQANDARPRLTGLLRGFTDVIALDATVVALPDKLAKLWPASRMQMQAALKVYTAVRATSGELLERAIGAERMHDINFVRSSVWKSGALYLADLAFTDTVLWKEISESGAFFVCRLKSNFKPTIVEVHDRTVGRCWIERKLREAIRNHHRVVDTLCRFNLRKLPHHDTYGQTSFRVVGLWDPKSKTRRLYVTNIPARWLKPQEIQLLYKLRWEVEIFYKLAKGGLGLGELRSGKPHIVRTLVDAALLRATLTMQAKQLAEMHLRRGLVVNPLAWCLVWRELFNPLALRASRFSKVMDWRLLASLAQEPNVNRVPNRRALLHARPRRQVRYAA